MRTMERRGVRRGVVVLEDAIAHSETPYWELGQGGTEEN